MTCARCCELGAAVKTGKFNADMEEPDLDKWLTQSENIDKLIAAHQAELNVLLNDKQQLRQALCRTKDIIKDLEEEIIRIKEDNKRKDQQIAQLNQRIADLQKPTTVNNNIKGNYIEKQIIGKSIHYEIKKRLKNHAGNDKQQLTLWQEQ